MKDLEEFTLKEVSDYIINKIVDERQIPEEMARKLFVNAISYNVVIEEINNQIDFLMED